MVVDILFLMILLPTGWVLASLLVLLCEPLVSTYRSVCRDSERREAFEKQQKELEEEIHMREVSQFVKQCRSRISDPSAYEYSHELIGKDYLP